MKKPLVFSFVKEQSAFMTMLMSLMSFLAILSLGIALSLGSAVYKWSAQWDKMATIQIMRGGDLDNVKKIISEYKNSLEYADQISDSEMSKMLTPWLKESAVLTEYLPKMFEIKFKNKNSIPNFAEKISAIPNTTFMTHNTGMQNAIQSGYKIIGISIFILSIIISILGISISYITRNIALIHKRELEILNQIGASHKFIIRQLQIIIAKISAIATLFGFTAATIVLLFINTLATNARVGFMTMMGLTPVSWTALALLGISIIIFATFITRTTTMKILTKNHK